MSLKWIDSSRKRVVVPNLKAGLAMYLITTGAWFLPCNSRANLDRSDEELIELQNAIVSRYHYEGKIASAPLTVVKRMLEDPPEIQDAVFVRYVGAGLGTEENPEKTVFGSTNYWRSASGKNGFFLSFGTTEAEATNMIYRGTMQGEFGSTNWRGADALPHLGGIVYSDGVSDSAKYFGHNKDREARFPLNLGIFLLVIGSVRFTDNTRFVAANTIDGKTNLDGALIASGKEVTGIAFEWRDPNANKSIWIVSFLKSDEARGSIEQAHSEIQFPVHKFAAHRIDPRYTNLVSETVVSYIIMRTANLPADYFRPTNWVSDRASTEGVVVRNVLFDKLRGRLILPPSHPYSSDDEHDPHRLLILIILALGMTVPIAVMLRAFRKRHGASL